MPSLFLLPLLPTRLHSTRHAQKHPLLLAVRLYLKPLTDFRLFMEPPARRRSLSFFSTFGFKFHGLLSRSKSSPSKTKHRADARLGTVIRTVPSPAEIPPLPTDIPGTGEVPPSKTPRRQRSNNPSRVRSTCKLPTKSFTVFRTRRYTKEPHRDSYIYQEFEVESPKEDRESRRKRNGKLPSIKISPPDGLPYRLPIEELIERPNSSAKSGTSSTGATSDADSQDKPLPPVPVPLSIDTKSILAQYDIRPPSRTPPSPPLSPPTDDDSPLGSCAHDFFPPPCRGPPSPPTSPISLSSSYATANTSLPKPSTPLLAVSDNVLLQTFTSLSSFSDLHSLILTHPRLHALYKGRSLYIHRQLTLHLDPVMHSLLEQLSPATGHTAETYISTSTDVFRTLSSVRELIRRSPCKNFLSPTLLDPSNETSNKTMYRALVHISAFCALFNFPSKISSTELQSQWLRQHLTTKELLSVLEMWQCLGVLLRPVIDDLELAASYQVISTGSIKRMREELEAFTSHLLTFGPYSLLPIFQDTSSVEERWEYICASGRNLWDRRESLRYRWFLRGVANEVYKEMYWEDRRGLSNGIEELR